MPKIDIDNYIEQSGMRKARFGGYEPEDVHQAMEDLCADYEQHLTAMTSELRTLQQENDALRRHAQGLVMQNQTLSTQNATLAGQVDKLQSYRANLETQFSTVKERSLSLGGAEIVETSMRSYPDGTVLPCISQGDGWVKTTYNGKTGYVSQDYLLVPVTVRASTGLNLRASASETAEKLLTIPNGTVVQCYGNKENEWARVAYNGKAGYVSYLYIAYD